MRRPKTLFCLLACSAAVSSPVLAGPVGARLQTGPQTQLGPLPPAPAPDGPRYSLIDGIALEVDERVVTWSDFAQRIGAARERTPIQTNAELEQLYADLTAASLQQLLAQQAGSELDIPLDRLDAILAQQLEDQRAPAGSLGYGETLRDQGVDPLGELSANRQEAFRIAYVNDVLGRQGLGVERPGVDRFLRPGQLRAFHSQLAEFESAPTVRLRLLDISSAATGGLTQARDLTEQLLADLKSGASFDELFDVYGSRFRETLGVQPPVSAAELEDEGLRAFAWNAEVGAISEVLPFRFRNSTGPEPDGYRIAALLTREAPREAPAFDQLQFQRNLRNRLLQETDRQRLARANALRFDRSHIWVHPILNTARRP